MPRHHSCLSLSVAWPNRSDSQLVQTAALWAWAVARTWPLRLSKRSRDAPLQMTQLQRGAGVFAYLLAMTRPWLYRSIDGSSTAGVCIIGSSASGFHEDRVENGQPGMLGIP